MPSIANGLFAGRAGIASHGTAIGVLGDNIANSNTTGFKASRADFTDLLAGNLGSGAGGLSVGSGSQVKSVKPVFTQGTLEFTGRGLDVAVDGNGFFLVQDNAGQRFYTRAGNFVVDKDGILRDQNGFQVLGKPPTGLGLQGLNVQNFTQTNINTTSVQISGNLDAGATGQAGGSFGSSINFSNLNTVSDFQTTINVFDGLGGKHAVSLFFVRNNTFTPTSTAATEWRVRAYIDGSDIRGTPTIAGGNPVALDNGAGTPVIETTIQFGPTGQRVSPAVGTPLFDNFGIPAGYTWANGAPAATLDIDLSPFTGFDNASVVNSNSQDGKGAGNVVTFSVQSDGTLFAQLDNGTVTSVGQLSLANFANPDALQRRGNSLFAQSNESGEPVIGTPQTGQFGAIQAGALELSTSDIASDFIKLITLQRGFQGSSRIITSINELLNDVINLVR